jgi:alpha-glucuronidase
MHWFASKEWDALQRRVLLLLAGAALGTAFAGAQTPIAWLRYGIPPDPPRYHDMPHAVVLLGDAAGKAAPEEDEAADELDRGLGHMVAGTDSLLHRFDPRLDAIVLGTTEALHRTRLGRSLPGWTEKPLPEEGFRIVHLRRGMRHWWILQGGSPRAELYAAYRFAALVAEDQQLPDELIETPALTLRAVDLCTACGDEAALSQVMNGIESERHGALPRLLASTGINAVIVDARAAKAVELAARLRPSGIRIWLRVPSETTEQEVERLASQIPGFGGVVLQVSASTDKAQLTADVARANAWAKLLRRHGAGVVLADALGTPLVFASDRAGLSPEERAAILHGGLEPNVVVSGPASSRPLALTGLGSANFGLSPGEPQAATFPIVPVTGVRDVAFPAAAWKSALETPERGAAGDTTLVKTLQPGGGMIGTLTVTDAAAMLRQPLLSANLYAFGRMAWNPALTPDSIAEEWARQTWGDDARIFGVAQHILMESAEAFGNASTPFGLPSLGDLGPDPARAALANGLPGIPLADSRGLGTDRTATGTGETKRYPAAFAAMLDDPSQCPDRWLLALHRVPYTATLRSGKTVAQGFYDAHFAGAVQASNAVDAWESIKDLVDVERYAAVHALLDEAEKRADIWRESTTEWLARVSGVPDASGFAGSHAGRIEAETMETVRYASQRTREPEDASAGALSVCHGMECSMTTHFRGEADVYRVEVGYFDELAGTSAFELRVNGAVRGRWSSIARGADPGGATAERFIVNGIRLKPDDRVEILAVPHDGAQAALDFVEITRDPRWN